MPHTKEEIDKIRKDLDDLRAALDALHRLTAILVNRHNDLENFLNQLRKECT